MKCPFPDDSGYGTVMVHPGLRLCEVGQDCPAGKKCEYAFKPEDVEPCPTCHNKPEEYVESRGGSLADTPWCPTCDVFGIQRKLVTINEAK